MFELIVVELALKYITQEYRTQRKYSLFDWIWNWANFSLRLHNLLKRYRLRAATLSFLSLFCTLYLCYPCWLDWYCWRWHGVYLHLIQRTWAKARLWKEMHVGEKVKVFGRVIQTNEKDWRKKTEKMMMEVYLETCCLQQGHLEKHFYNNPNLNKRRRWINEWDYLNDVGFNKMNAIVERDDALSCFVAGRSCQLVIKHWGGHCCRDKRVDVSGKWETACSRW